MPIDENNLESLNIEAEVMVGRFLNIKDKKKLCNYIPFNNGMSFNKEIIHHGIRIIKSKSIDQPGANPFYENKKNIPDDAFIFIINNKENLDIDFMEFDNLDPRIRNVIEENLKTKAYSVLVRGKINLLNLHISLSSKNIFMRKEIEENILTLVNENNLSFSDSLKYLYHAGRITSLNNDNFTYEFNNIVALEENSITRYDAFDKTVADLMHTGIGQEYKKNINLIPIYKDEDKLMLYLLDQKDAKLNFIDYQRIMNFLTINKIKYDWLDEGKFTLNASIEIMKKEKLGDFVCRYMIKRIFNFNKVS